MELIGQSERNPVAPGITGIGPMVVWGDDVPHRLLYLRRIWDFSITPEDLARTIEAPGSASSRQDPREQTWLEAWQQAWKCNKMLYTHAPAENMDFPEQQPPEWFTTAGLDGAWDEKYRSWQVENSQGGNLGDRPTALIIRAESAAARGLKSIYAVPVEGHWAASGRNILAVSPDTFGSDATLITLLDRRVVGLIE